jgi:FkbM family methyltransferase
MWNQQTPFRQLSKIYQAVLALGALERSVYSMDGTLREAFESLRVELQSLREQMALVAGPPGGPKNTPSDLPLLPQRARVIRARVNNMESFDFEIHNREDRFISGILAATGCWEPFETEIFRRLLRPDDYVIDIGANIGWYGVLAAKLLGEGGRVMTFEPDPDNFAMLRRNLMRSGSAAVVETRQEAVGEQAGAVKLYLSTFNMGDHHLFDDGESRESVDVPLTTLDEVFADRKRLPTILKSDTQGSEARILKGARKLLAAGWRPIMVLEFWPYGLSQSGDDALRLWTELEQLGYAMYEVNEDDPRLRLLDSQDIRARLLGPMTPASQTFINLLALQPGSDRLPALSDLFE